MKTLLFYLHFISALLIFTSLAQAQSSWKELTSAELILETSGVPKSDPFEIGFLVRLKPGWHTYWKNSGDSGAGPRFDWSPHSEEISGPVFPTPMTFEDSGIVTFGYEDQVLFVFKHAGVSESQTLKVSAEWLVCKDICLPAMADFEISIPVMPVEEIQASKNRKFFEAARRRWPLPGQADVSIEGTNAKYSMALEKTPKDFSFFPFKTTSYFKISPTSTEFKDGRFAWTMPLSNPNQKLADLGGVVSFDFGDHGKSYDLQLNGAQANGGSSLSLIWALLFAFIGGLILNLMPCVFPILSLKLFSVLKTSGHDSKKVRIDNLAYVGGVLFTFILLGLGLTIFREAGVQIGWGFQLQSPLFVGCLILLFIVLALEMFGFFSFDLLDPSKGHSLTRKEGFWGSFFTGVLAVVVASPCSAPFMGAAVGAALTQEALTGPLIFLVLGIGLSFPYLILAFAPQLLRWVPRPGAWMNTVKELMAFPLLLTALWLLWIFTHIAHSEDLAALGVCLIGIIFGIWLSSYSRVAAWVIASIFLGAWVLHGIFKAPPLGQASVIEESSGWTRFSEDALLSRKAGEVFFVNMTADWCITCKVNERLIFETSEVKGIFNELGIKKIKGDWTKRDPVITAYLDRFGRAGVPFYVIYSDRSPAGEILSEVLTKDRFITKLKEHSIKGDQL